MSSEDIQSTIESEKQKILLIKSRRVTYLAVTIVAIFLVMGYSFTVGSSSMTASTAYKILINQLFAGIWPGLFGEFSANEIFIVMDLRAPRVLVAALIGAILAIGGCIMQSILKNPLATPYTLGVSSGACVGASLYYIFGISIVGGTAGLITNTFICSLIPVAVMMIAITRRNVSPVTLVLSGVAFSYVFSSLNSIMQYFGDDSAVTNVVFWTIGDLTSSDMWMVPILAIALLVYLVYGLIFGKDMDIMRMGDDTASSLGINVKFVRGSALIMACFMTAVAVACAGPIGFVCLLAPHICRKLVGSDMRWLIPMSACAGSMLLLIADMIAKSVLAPVMLPVGAITAILGAPVMVYMLYSKRGLRS
ncbi:MAG: iron ABC transporter permease [Thermoplasmata archaeon]|nr:iron ABC transporter permease [Thermoplasmata archaeon]